MESEIYLRLGDLARRWGYSKQGVQKLAKREDFPAPCFTLNHGKIRIWAVREVEAFERERPELLSEDAKLRKVAGFLRAINKGERRGHQLLAAAAKTATAVTRRI